MSSVLFEDIFRVHGINLEGDHFQGVNRLHCTSEYFKMDMLLDVNSALFPLEVGDRFRFVLSSSLSEYGYPDSNEYDHLAVSGLDACVFDYIMYGKVYRVDENSGRVALYISFGGLLCRLQGDLGQLTEINIDDNIFLLTKKYNLNMGF